MNSIEEKLWNYIDGSCTPEEQKAIGILIEQDEIYRRKYQELLNLSIELLETELDEPPMAFTYNVMETIRAENARTPLKAAIDTRIIKGISIFFVLTILGGLILALGSINWSAGGIALHVPSQLALPDLKSLFSSSVIQGFLFFDTILALFLFDAYLRKKGYQKQT